MEEILLKLPINNNMSISESQEIYIDHAFELYSISLEIAKHHILSNPQSPANLYITKLRQISCEFLYISFDIEQEMIDTPINTQNSKNVKKNSFSQNVSNDDISHISKLLIENHEIFFEMLKIVIRTMILIFSQDLNKYSDILFKDISLARLIYAEYLISPNSNEHDFIVLIEKDLEKVKIITLFYLIDLEISSELIENFPIENTIQSFQKVFELFESSIDNALFEKSCVLKLLNIYLRAIIKLIRKSGLKDKNVGELFKITGFYEKGEFKGIFRFLGMEDHTIGLLIKLMVLYKMEKNETGIEELLSFYNEEDIKEKEVFISIIEGKKYSESLCELNQSASERILHNFVKLLDLGANAEEVFAIIEIWRVSKNQRIFKEMINSLLGRIININNIEEDYIEQVIIYIMSKMEEIVSFENFDVSSMELMFNIVEKKQIKPKILLFFSQKMLRIIVSFSFSSKKYEFSFILLERLLSIMQKSFGKNNLDIYREAMYIQLNNVIMIKKKPLATKIYETLNSNENINEKAFFKLLIELKYKFYMNFAKIIIFQELLRLIQHEDFDFQVFYGEIMDELTLDSSQIKIIIEALLESLNFEKIQSFLSFWKEKRGNCCLLTFFRPIIKDLIIDGEKKEDFRAKFTQEKVKILMSLGNFLEDAILLSIENDNIGEFGQMCNFEWLINEEENSIFESFFWNLM